MEDRTISIYELECITGIDAEVLAGMVEENRIRAEIIDGEYRITRDSFKKWAEQVIDELF